MGWLESVGGALVGGGIGFLVGGPAGAVIGAGAGLTATDGGDTSSSGSNPPPVDYSDAMIASSNNSQYVDLAQIMSQEFAMQQSSLDRNLQLAANLELGLEKLDTSLQTGKMDFIQGMTSESNRHTEKLASISIQHAVLMNGGQAPTDFDIPAPAGF